MPNPTAFEQEMLELVNHARLDPAGEFDRLITDAQSGTAVEPRITSAIRWTGVDLDALQSQLAAETAVAPLAWNTALASAARAHSDLMIAFDQQSHRLPGEDGLGARIEAQGYDDWRRVGENVFAYTESPLYGHAGFYIDWGYDDEDIAQNGQIRSDWQSRGDGIQDPAGHRNAIMSDGYTEIGIAAVAENDPASDVGPYVVTQNFGTRAAVPVRLVGVVYQDDGDGRYEAGEGVGGVGIAQGGRTVQSWAAGGFQIDLSDGTGATAVTVSNLPGQPGTTEITLAMTGANAKLDLAQDGQGAWTLLSSASLTLEGGSAPVTQYALLGGEALDLTALVDRAVAMTGNDAANAITGGGRNDRLTGQGGADTITGNDGHDLLAGGDGADLIYGGAQHDTIEGGAGNDTVWGGNGQDLVSLDAGADLFIDNAQAGAFGRDTVFAGLGDDTIQGGNGDDMFRGEDGNDLIFGRLGNDALFGGTGFDTISGGDGNDTVDGGNGRDLVFLNQGDDLFLDNAQGGAPGRDTVFGGYGHDTVEGGNGADVFHGEWGNDVIRARLGDDSVYGGDGFDVIDAGDGDDLVFGGNGRDRVLLGAGDDRYVDTGQAGTLGQDTVTGGAGADVFEFGAVMSADVITDFETGVDSLVLSATLAAGRDAAQLLAETGSVTATGVLIDFGGGATLLLDGLTTLTGLETDLTIL